MNSKALILVLLVAFVAALPPAKATTAYLLNYPLAIQGGVITPIGGPFQIDYWRVYPSNSTIALIITGFELIQKNYHFSVTVYGNLTLYILLKGSSLVPTVSSRFGFNLFTAGLNNEQVSYPGNNKAVTDDLCIVYSGNCGTITPSGPGGSGGGGFLPAVASYVGPGFFVYQIALVAAIIGLIFIIGFARNRRRSSN